MIPPRTLLKAGLRYQIRHRWQLLLALVGVAMGVAVVLAVDLANGAARASFATAAEEVRGAATHRVVGSDGEVPETVYRDLFTTPGHPPMAPVIDAWVTRPDTGQRLRLLGLDLFAEDRFRTGLSGLVEDSRALGDWLAKPGMVTISRSAADHLGLGSGDALTVTHRARPETLQVFGIGSDTTFASRDLLVADIATAQAVTDMRGRLSHIDLILDDAALQWLQQHLPAGVTLRDAREQARATAGLSAAFELNLTAMSLLALLVGVFLIFNAISFSIVQRRNLLGRLRAIGVRGGELGQLVLFEATVLAVVGTLVGTVLGYWLGQGLTRIVAATVSELYYQVSVDAAQLDPGSLAKAWALGLLGTWVAAWLPARQGMRTPALTTLSRAALEQQTRRQVPRLALAGMVLLAAGLAVAIFFPGGVLPGFTGLFVLLIGAALLTPAALRLTHRLLRRLPLPDIWRLAVRDLDRHMSRLGTATAALMIALAASVGVAVMVDSMRGAVSDWLRDLLTADVYVAAAGFEEGATLPPAVIAAARAMPGITALSSYRSVDVQHERGKIRAIATELAEPSRHGFDILESEATDPWTAFDAGALLLSEPLARRLSLRPGDELRLDTPGGPGSFRIAAIFRDFASEHGRFFIARSRYLDHWPDTRIDTLALFAPPGHTAGLLDAATRQLPGRESLVITVADEIHRESMAVFERTFTITEVLRVLSLTVAFIGVLSALMALQLERRKEYAVLRALGLTRGQVTRLVVIGSCLLGLIAGVLALPVGLMMAWILTEAIQLRAFGWSMPFVASLPPLGWTLFTGLAAATLASLYPAWRAAAHDPAPMLRED